MFMYVAQTEQDAAERHLNNQPAADAENEVIAYQDLLNTVDAARTGLASGEHDYDDSEDVAL